MCGVEIELSAAADQQCDKKGLFQWLVNSKFAETMKSNSG
jgi:hypothetical protein